MLEAALPLKPFRTVLLLLHFRVLGMSIIEPYFALTILTFL